MKEYQFIVIEFTLICILGIAGVIVMWLPKIFDKLSWIDLHVTF